MMMRSCRENVALPALGQRGLRNGILVNRQRERSLVGQVLGRVHLHPLSPERDVGQFSGGNQQKVLLGKGLTRPMRLFVLDEPTVGVDVATRAAIYRFVAELCAQGVAILLVSSDLPEVLHLSHRLYVMHQGRVQAELAGPEISERNVLAHFFGRSAA
jgi:ribose transport system ATP-binding protein